MNRLKFFGNRQAAIEQFSDPVPPAGFLRITVPMTMPGIIATGFWRYFRVERVSLPMFY